MRKYAQLFFERVAPQQKKLRMDLVILRMPC